MLNIRMDNGKIEIFDGMTPLPEKKWAKALEKAFARDRSYEGEQLLKVLTERISKQNE